MKAGIPGEANRTGDRRGFGATGTGELLGDRDTMAGGGDGDGDTEGDIADRTCIWGLGGPEAVSTTAVGARNGSRRTSRGGGPFSRRKSMPETRNGSSLSGSLSRVGSATGRFDSAVALTASCSPRSVPSSLPVGTMTERLLSASFSWSGRTTVVGVGGEAFDV
eukprot:TRINITY_DN7427_c0_g1_i3.p2 TRINITY_DN7427_c0_g1~~TRINITY_DN7427_c0_g1_i3.p2  ORF type:complete len:164 (-),score=8.91 TRINITY_DN7427_c0_g1_i3:234-725(-)